MQKGPEGSGELQSDPPEEQQAWQSQPLPPPQGPQTGWPQAQQQWQQQLPPPQQKWQHYPQPSQPLGYAPPPPTWPPARACSGQ